MTSLAVVLVLAIFLNKKRSKARPSSGASTTTDSRNESHTGKFSSWTNRVKA